MQGPSIVLPVWICIMFNGSYLRACMKLWFVKKLDFPFMSLGGPSHGARVWCLGRVPKHRNQWQEIESLLFSPKNSQLVHILSFLSQGCGLCKKLDFPFLSLGGPSHGARVWCLGRVSRILSFHSQGVVSLFIFPTSLTALDFEPYGRRYTKNTGHDRNRLYSRALHCPASMEMHYVQWFLLKSVYEIMVCEKIRFSLHESGWTKPWCPGLVSWPSAKA